MSTSKRPNVVVFFTDQQRHDSAGVFGNPLGLTPNFDHFARTGTLVEHSFTCQPVCGPARACLQTGMYPTATGNWCNGKALDPAYANLGKRFKAAGYATGYVGKWHLGRGDSGPVNPEHREGYDYWLASNSLEMTSTAYHTTMYDGAGQAVFLPGYRADAVTDAAIRYIAGAAPHPLPRPFNAKSAEPGPTAAQERPFFLFVSLLEPHHQNHLDDYPPPAGHRQMYDGRWTPPDLAALGGSAQQHLAGYWGMVKRVDAAFGRLLDALRSLGILDNSIVLYTSDHACHFKTRNAEYKRSCHEASIRVPTAFGGPGFSGRGVRELVSLIDLPPTLLDAAGVAVPGEMQGRSIMPLVRGTGADWRDEVFIQISESQVGRALRTRRWKYCVTAPEANGWTTPAAERYVEQYLYDLEADPYELSNLVGMESHAEVAAWLRGRLIARIAEAGEGAVEIVPAESKGSGQRRVFADEFV